MSPFDDLTTLDELRAYVREAYAATLESPSFRSDAARTLHEESGGGPMLPPQTRLPLAVAEPGPLMERAVELAGDLSLQQIRDLFSDLGAERFDRGLAYMRSSGRVVESREKRPNRAGRPQEQVVFRSLDAR